MSGFKKLLVWQKADELAFQLYMITREFPKDELYGITSQIRRAAVSVAANIAEGSGRRNRNETRQFVNIALGSLAEVDSLLGFTRRLGFISQEQYVRLDEQRRDVGGLLNRLYLSL